MANTLLACTAWQMALVMAGKAGLNSLGIHRASQKQKNFPLFYRFYSSDRSVFGDPVPSLRGVFRSIAERTDASRSHLHSHNVNHPVNRSKSDLGSMQQSVSARLRAFG